MNSLELYTVLHSLKLNRGDYILVKVENPNASRYAQKNGDGITTIPTVFYDFDRRSGNLITVASREEAMTEIQKRVVPFSYRSIIDVSRLEECVVKTSQER